ncbi:MAG: RNA 2',3'-cyclic phosphodiesterase [Chloroflexota bacterium]|nr:RNA 2',3'-cyclic phosphodiesterase [Chloroflexota bacterium]
MRDEHAGRRWRLFVAAPVPPPAAEALWRQLEPMRRRHPHARWLPPEQLHATLVFVGPIDPTRAGVLSRAISAVSAGQPRFAVSTGAGDGRADNRRGGVAWLRLAEGSSAVRRLALSLDQAMATNTYHSPPPRPHVTVARRVAEALLADLRVHSAGVAADWIVDAVVLFRSRTLPTGAHYEAISAHPLTEGHASP